jgi:DNA-binding transcriptional MerR regulator
MSTSRADLTIGAVADQTGVAPATLRSWERRYGFPVAVRVPSGHRRYTSDHVDEVLAVLHDRDAGMSLEAAIGRAMARATRPEPSIYAGLRRRWPQLPVHLLSRRAMLAISRAIEDECCAQAERPVLIASFQRERFYRRSEARWRELARTAAVTAVFADFPTDRVRRRAPAEISLPDDAPLLREWAVVCDGADAAACLAGIERPASAPTRRFEAVWSVDPAVVRDAATIGARLAQRADGPLHIALGVRPAPDHGRLFDRATALTNRIVAYLDR